MRAAYRTTDLDDSGAWTIPSVREYLLSTPYRVAMLSPVGADGAYDLHGDNRAPMGLGTARVKALVSGANAAALQTALDNLYAGCGMTTRSLGRKKLWTREASGSTLSRWTYARVAARVSLSWQPGKLLWNETDIDFLLEDPRFYDALTEARLTALGLTPVTLNTAIVPEAIDPNLIFA